MTARGKIVVTILILAKRTDQIASSCNQPIHTVQNRGNAEEQDPQDLLSHHKIERDPGKSDKHPPETDSIGMEIPVTSQDIPSSLGLQDRHKHQIEQRGDQHGRADENNPVQ